MIDVLDHLQCISLFSPLKYKNSIIEVRYATMYSSEIAISKYRIENTGMLFLPL